MTTIEQHVTTYLARLNELGHPADQPVHSTFVVEGGRKYYKVIQEFASNRSDYVHRSVHSFVDKANGDLYKPATWKGPSQKPRWNLARDQIHSLIDLYGSYLYQNFIP